MATKTEWNTSLHASQFAEKLQQRLLIFTRGNVSQVNFACSAFWHNEDVRFRTFTVCVRFNTNRAVLAFKRLSKVSLHPDVLVFKTDEKSIK